MYIRINQIKLEIDEDEGNLLEKAAKKLAISKSYIEEINILKKSIDGRHKTDIKYSYSVIVKVDDKLTLSKKIFDNNVTVTEPSKYVLPLQGEQCLDKNPVIVGMGPAGLFCGYFLALHGYKPIIIERGENVDERKKTVDCFFETGRLNKESNVQFGEGGAGTFSDGKLNTTVKDISGRNRLVLDTFVKFGADESITYINKPHIGTDVLTDIVKRMRTETEKLGGRVLFNTRLDDIEFKGDKADKIKVTNTKTGKTEIIDTKVLVLALGHSARDTFKMLSEHDFIMEQKPFAVGVRVEHKQRTVNLAKYGEKYLDKLPAADYKVTYTTKAGRGVYSFCMCPGGYVVNASSEEGRLAVNGMSYSKRDGENANSAIVVTVRPEDFPGKELLDGIEYQRNLEERAYKACNGKIPVQRFEDFKNEIPTESLGEIKPNIKGKYDFADINNILPEYICESIKEAMPEFAKDIKDFDNPDTLLLAVESRTSSPVRIIRDETFESNIKGVYPCGEGAGYAGGITSAAIDGIKVFEAIYKKYKNMY